jgi:F-type H+-transporting ATPase subunit delta
MFQAEHWAVAFTELCGRDIDEGLEAIRSFVACAAEIKGRFSGTAAGARFERELRKAMGEAGFGPANRGTELAVRLLVCLIRKDYFKYHLALLNEIEKAVDRIKGILQVKVETVKPLDQDLEEKIKAELKKQTGVREIILNTRIVPGLIAGYRIFIGFELLDTSIRKRLRKLGAELGLSSQSGGDMIPEDDLMQAVWESV